MSKSEQKKKAQQLLSLHTSGKLLILPNIWDPIGARILEAKGYPAVATASAAVSASLGYEDGEQIKRSTLGDRINRCGLGRVETIRADGEATSSTVSAS